MPSRATYLAPTGPVQLALRRLSATHGHDEGWLQQRLYQHPHLLPTDEIERGAGDFVPVCMEMQLPGHGAGAPLRLDLFGVTPTGRLVLVECKRWRNPQARREVIGQILEYASLMAGRTYGDLEARLNATMRADPDWEGPNPLHRHVCRRLGEHIDEAMFVDAVERSLARGELMLIVAGDGIHANARGIAETLERRGGLAARLALVEIEQWHDGAGGVLLMPRVVTRTEIVRHRVLVDRDGLPLAMDDDPAPAGRGGERQETSAKHPGGAGNAAARIAANRAFWQRFIDTLELDHPEQERPRHDGNNRVRLPLPGLPAGLVVFRSGGERKIGVFLRPRGDASQEILERLENDDTFRAEIEDATGTRPVLETDSSSGAPPTMGVERSMDVDDPDTESAQMEWLTRTTNAMVNALRPRLAVDEAG